MEIIPQRYISPMLVVTKNDPITERNPRHCILCNMLLIIYLLLLIFFYSKISSSSKKKKSSFFKFFFEDLLKTYFSNFLCRIYHMKITTKDIIV